MLSNLILFGKKLRELRIISCISQKRLSQLTGIDEKTIGRIERGLVIPKIETLEYLSDFYAVDLLELYVKCRMENLDYFNEIQSEIEKCITNKSSLTPCINKLSLYLDNCLYKSSMLPTSQLIDFLRGMQAFFNEDYDQSLNYLLDSI